MSDNISKTKMYNLTHTIDCLTHQILSDLPIWELENNQNAQNKVIAAYQVTAGHSFNVGSIYKWYIGEDSFYGLRKLVIGEKIYTIAIKCISRHRRHIINCSGYQFLSDRPIWNLMGNPHAQHKVFAAFQVTSGHNLHIAGYSWYISKRFKNKSSRQLVIGKEIYTITLICI